ncbi:MAG: RCC1 domain-containing protein, partial [Eubacteriales bacterium]
MVIARARKKSRSAMILLTILFLWIQMRLFYLPAPALSEENKSPDTQQKSPYKDVPANEPNFIFINYLNSTGLLKGFPDGNFRPASGLTRAEAAAVLVKAAGLKLGSAQAGFKDVSSSYWAAKNIAAAKNAGLLKGYLDGTFRPEAKLTRAEGITLILKLSKQPDPGAALPALADVSPKHWAARPIAVGIASEMTGLASDNKHFLPDSQFTRGSLARALAVLLTRDPVLNQASLTDKVNVIKGTITITRPGSKSPEVVKEGTEIKPGDTVNTGSNSSADLIFPDGTGLRLDANTELILKEAKGRSYIKADGTPGTAVEWLALDLKLGKLYGALATAAGSSEEKPTTASNTVKAAALRGIRTGVTTAAVKTVTPPWWKITQTKRTRVKVDMPAGVAAIRGTFWENRVDPDGSFKTTLLTGDAEVTASGQTVSLEGGQRTEVKQAGKPPDTPTPLTSEDKKEWLDQKEWAEQRAAEIETNQEEKLPEPPPADKPEEALPSQDEQKTDITGTIKDALDSAGKPDNTSNTGGGGRTPSNVPVTGVTLDRHTLTITTDSSPVSLIATVTPANASNKNVNWSSNSAVATVAYGSVTPVSTGTAVITVTTVDGSFTDSCTVTVTSPSPPSPTTTIRINSVERASISDTELQANDTSGGGEHFSSLSADGRYIAFYSYANNLVLGDANGLNSDIFVRDRQSGTTVLVSVATDGTQGNSGSRFPFISADGRFVVFDSGANNLVAGDTNGREDIFVRDRDMDNDGIFDEPGAVSTSRVSVATDGTQTNAGSFSMWPSISSDGRYVAFYSDATTLVPDDTNGYYDIFVHDRQTNTTQRVSVSSTGVQADTASYFPHISANGRYVAFSSGATTLVPGITTFGIFVRDLQANTTSYIAPGSDPVMSSDGRYITFSADDSANLVAGDTNGQTDIFVRDRDADGNGIFDEDGKISTARVNVSSTGTQANGFSYTPSISDNGRYVTFTSQASNLVPDDTNADGDIFFHDTQTHLTKRVSVSLTGEQGNDGSWYSWISADGSYVAFTSDATNLAAGDTNGRSDVYVAGLDPNAALDTVAPTAPTGLAAVQTGPSYMKLTWNPASDNVRVVRYAVYRAGSLTGPFTQIATVNGSVYSYWDTSLIPATTYYYYITAGDEDGNWSLPPAPMPMSTTVELNTVAKVTYLAAGYRYSLARTSDGAAWAWGDNSYGHLGSGTALSFSTSPLPVVGDAVYLTNIASIDGYYHTVAVKSDRTVWAWGDNRYGQLGIGDLVNRPTPMQVKGRDGSGYLTGITAVATGEMHTLALKSDGTVWAWGDNGYGQLGYVTANGAANDSYTPVPVQGPDGTGYLTDIIAVAAGSAHSIALKSDGTVWTWGQNAYGA